MSNNLTYIELLLHRAYEINMQKYLPLTYNYYNHNIPLYFVNNGDNYSTYDKCFYNFLCSFANSELIIDPYKSLQAAVKDESELPYKKPFYRVKEGVLIDNDSAFFMALSQIDELGTQFILNLFNFIKEENMPDEVFDEIVNSGLYVLPKIAAKYDDPSYELTAVQFAELCLIRRLSIILNDTHRINEILSSLN